MDHPRYTLANFQDFMFSGFQFAVPEGVMRTITELTSKVSNHGSAAVTFVKGTSFANKAPVVPQTFRAPVTSLKKPSSKSKKSNASPVPSSGDACDWDNVRSGEKHQKEPESLSKLAVSRDPAQMEEVRALLNKLTDKNVADTTTKLQQILASTEDPGLVSQVGGLLFDVASNNRFFSRLYAQVFAQLAKQFVFLSDAVRNHWAGFMDLFLTIEFVDASEDYDKFCDNNKKNERRKSLAAFYVNLVREGLVAPEQLHDLLIDVLALAHTYVQEAGRKNEVDELAETIALLFAKDVIPADGEKRLVNGTMNALELVTWLSQCKVKDLPSYTNKALFKFMDLRDAL